MNKKLLAAAVAGVFTAPVAFAQSSNVELYGRINAGVDNASATGATLTTGAVNQDFKARMRQFDTGSRLGVRGTEDLGNGLRAVFQIESGVNSDNGQNASQSGAAQNASTGFLGSRPTWVGLDGAMGTVKFGRQDVFWGNGTINQTGPNHVNTDIPWLTGGSGRVSAGVTRQSNVVTYTTPTMSGLNATLSWSPDTTAGGANTVGGQAAANAESATAGKNTNANLLGLTVRGAWGPYQLQYDFVTKTGSNDQAGAVLANQTTVARTFANKLGLAWAYQPGGQISLIGTAIHVQNQAIAATESIAGAAVAAGVENLNQNTLSVTWEHLVGGNILLLAQYGQMMAVKGCSAVANVQANVCDNSKATGYMAGVRYNLSKRTAVFASYNKVSNGSNNYADYAGGAYQVGPLAAVNKGADPQIVAVGVQHNF
jgi:predicted porin